MRPNSLLASAAGLALGIGIATSVDARDIKALADLEGSGEDAADFLESVVLAIIGQCGQAVVESGSGFDKLEP